MRQFYHHPLDPRSRYLRLVLAERQLPASFVDEPFWQRRPDFLAVSVAGEVPVLVEPGDDLLGAATVLPDAVAAAEYFEDRLQKNDVPLLPPEPRARAEARRLVNWFLGRFLAEAATPLLTERVWKRLAATGEPDTNLLRAGAQNLRQHLAYLQYLTAQRGWLAGDKLSLADLAAAAACSSLDYLGAIPWEEAADAKDWYARIKSRPAFRALLLDHLPGLPPARHYTDLDF